MEDEQKIEIINEIINISEKFVSPFKSYNSRFVRDKGICFYVKNGNQHYDPLLGDIFKYMELKHNFSSDYVRDFIDDLISDTLKEGIEKVKKDPLIIDTFDEVFHEVTVYLPLSGIKMNEDELKIGKIRIRKMNKEIVDKIASNLELLLLENPYYNTKAKEKAIERLTNHILRFEDKVCAEFKMFGEESIVLKVAEKECEKSLDLLRLSSIYLQHKGQNITITLDGETARGFQNIIIFKSNFKSYKITNRFKGSMLDFSISNEKIRYMEDFGIFILSIILEKPERELTDFEKTILMGIHWFANSPNQREVENQYLSLMVALEIFLTPRSGSGEPITNYIAEGASIINEVGIDNRKNLKKEIKGLYKKRSSIVHGSLNKDNSPTEDDVLTLRNILLGLIFWMIQNSNRFESKDDLLDFLENHKLACDILT